jgi:excinuclease ABC subunit B
LDADKEGFLRSRTSLIQTMGRAARHLHGEVILYADVRTKSMEAAISEVERRRSIQLDYNQKNAVTPLSIIKPIRSRLVEKEIEVVEDLEASMAPEAIEAMTPMDKKKQLSRLTQLMREASKALDFETAARYRDMITALNAR